MAFSKIILNGTTLMDVTQDTVAANNLLSSYTAHGADGQAITGSASSGTDVSDTTATAADVLNTKYFYTSSGVKTQGSMSAMTLPTSASASATSGYTSKATISRSTSNQYINIPPGYNSAGGYYTVSAVANGTEGTPTATKGTVSNHQVSVTPSVTNSAGYISGGSHSGTAVTVTASELASGNKAIVDNGTNIDVVGYSTVSVAVPFATITTSSSNPSGGSNGDIWIKTS